MARDEAPAAATGGGFNGKRNSTEPKSGGGLNAGLDSRRGPTSLVAVEIHPGPKPAGNCDGWLHCNIQVACHLPPLKLSLFYSMIRERIAAGRARPASNYEHAA
jgi:hypothetical protein